MDEDGGVKLGPESLNLVLAFEGLELKGQRQRSRS